MAENTVRCIEIQVKDGYSKKYNRAYNIREHQKRKRLKKKWDNIINRYDKKYTTVKCITRYTVVNIVDRTDYTNLTDGCFSLSLKPITYDKGPED